MGNELKLFLENFQSISHGELIFQTGINTIIGQSNSGKTATFRALKACLSNPAGSQRFIKKGTSKSSVTLEYNNNQIVWKRTSKESSYTINGEDFIKTGKSNAFKLVEDTGFVIDDTDTIMNIEEELQLPFPFGIPKSELFKLYENVFCVSDSSVILKSAKGEEDKIKIELSSLENELVKSNNKLEELLSFKKEVDIDFLKERRHFFKECLKKINFLKDGLRDIKAARNIQDFRIEEQSFNNKYISLNELYQLKKTLKTLKDLHSLGKELKDLNFPSFIDFSEYKSLRELSKYCKKLNVIKNIKVDEREFQNKLNLYEELKEYSTTLKLLKESIKERKTALNDITEQLKQKEGKLKEFKVCPLCHKSLN